ncbi:MAG: hypothetical protein KIT16_07115 [Rhodospirillaceae bacterium]|nr:hypothetical protein [Rhodospirillaceae bacterium]
MTAEHESARRMVAVLGDSRAFDTYYVNESYPRHARYGYDKTFAHLLSRSASFAPSRNRDVVLIPDHFRGGTVESNIIRLALTDPDVVVLCDGIWETLVNKDWFLEWVAAKVRAPSATRDGAIDLTYSSEILAKLFVAGELPVAPQKYAAKQRRIISYFRRRRRQCIWLGLTTPPRDYLGRLHYAGNYRCIPEWDECLRAVNAAMRPVIRAYGAEWLDLDDLVQANGGYAAALIDQWHFSIQFHAAIASELEARLARLLGDSPISRDHVSRGFLLASAPGDTPLALYGRSDRVAQWRAANRAARSVAVLGAAESEPADADLPVVTVGEIGRLGISCIVLTEGPDTPAEEETSLLERLPAETILLYPSELGAIDNPVGSDREQHARLRP